MPGNIATDSCFDVYGPQLSYKFGVDSIRAKCPPGVTEMSSKLAYHSGMKRLLSAATVVLALSLIVPLLCAQNQSRGVSSSPGASSMHGSFSMRSSFRAPTGPTFVPRLGIGPGFRSPTPCCGTFSGGFTFGVGSPRNPFYPQNFGHRHHGRFNNAGGFVAYPVPYAVPVYPYPYYGSDTGEQDSQDGQAAEEAQQEAPAPTIFENRARRAAPPSQPAPENSYAEDSGTIAANVAPAPQAQPSAPEQTSVLIFRDGHQLEMQNYAIVGDTLYDLTPGHPRKIALARIDIPATVEANDDRGVVFRVPLPN